LGSHIPPPEIAVVPPYRGARSITVTRAPPTAAARAATSAAPPDPTTATSVWTVSPMAGPFGAVSRRLTEAETGSGGGRLGGIRVNRLRPPRRVVACGVVARPDLPDLRLALRAQGGGEG